jgi:hypothetical protein
MVGQRAKHLSHAEAAAAVPAEAGFSIGHCDFQGHAGVLDARIVAMRMQAREHADAVVADDDFERARPRRERDKTCARRLAVAEDIVLELAEGADNLGRDASREAGGEGGLICPARPKLPQIRSLRLSATSMPLTNCFLQPRPAACPVWGLSACSDRDRSGPWSNWCAGTSDTLKPSPLWCSKRRSPRQLRPRLTATRHPPRAAEAGRLRLARSFRCRSPIPLGFAGYRK